MGNVKVNCGDWGLGWGFGGKDKIGKLTKLKDGSYLWEGHSQGRHKRIWNKGASINFRYDNNEFKKLKSNGGYPFPSSLIEGVSHLEIAIDEYNERQYRKLRAAGIKKDKVLVAKIQLKLEL